MSYSIVSYSRKKKTRSKIALFPPFFISLLLLLVILLRFASATEIIHGKVIRVLDGDTVHLLADRQLPGAKLHKNGSISVRLRGIDSPEKRQPYGIEAKDNLKRIIKGKTVSVKVGGIDRHGRLAGHIYLNGKNINLKQVESGFAWAYTKYLDRPYVSKFYEAEKEARKAKRGLWKDNNPTPPWEWRRRR